MTNANRAVDPKMSLPAKLLAVALSVAMAWMFSFPFSAWAEGEANETAAAAGDASSAAVAAGESSAAAAVAGEASAAAATASGASVTAAATGDGEELAQLWEGAGTADSPYLIMNANHLTALQTQVNMGIPSKGIYYKLGADITLPAGSWTPIGNGTRLGPAYVGNAFKGVFDGGGHTINGLVISGNASSANAAIGLFGVLDGATVKNLALGDVDVNVPNAECIGALAGLMVNGSTVDNVTVTGKVTAKRGVGGLVGRMTKSGTISNCTNSAAITASGANAGGIVGAAYYTAAGKAMTISGCVNHGAVTNAAGDVGGIVGLSAANVEQCENDAAVSGNGASVGGIAGEQQNFGSLKGNANSGAVTNASATVDSFGTGGIVGWVRYNGAKTDYPAKAVITVSGNSNSAAVKGGNDGGGIIGTLYNAGVVTDNVNTAPSVSGKTFAAGIVGNYQAVASNVVGDIPVSQATIERNTSTTPMDAISAQLTAPIVYLNTTEGVTLDGNVSQLPADSVTVNVPAAGSDVQVDSAQAGLASAKETAQSAVETIMGGKTPAGMSDQSAQQVASAISGAQSNAITVAVVVGAQKLDAVPAAEEPQMKAQVTAGEAPVATFDLTVSMKVTAKKADGTTGEAVVPLTELDEPVVFSLQVPPASIADAYVRVITVHDGVASEADVVGVDRATGVVKVSASRFSTYTVFAAQDLPVTFDSTGGSAVAAQNVAYGQKAAEPAAPTREGYTFDGWYTDAALTTPYDFATPVEAPLTLYAKWTAVESSSSAGTTSSDSSSASSSSSGSSSAGSYVYNGSGTAYRNSYNNYKNYRQPQTGDEVGFAIVGMLALAALSAGALVLARRRMSR